MADEIGAAIERLDQLAADRKLTEDVLRPLRAHYHERLRHFGRGADRGDGHRLSPVVPDEIELLLIAAERDLVNELHRRGALKDEARRHLERELDLREATLANHQHEE